MYIYALNRCCFFVFYQTLNDFFYFPECYYSDAFPAGSPESSWLYNEENSPGEDIHIRVKRSNDTPSPTPKQYANAVEEFYADPNNRAMYLVLPLIVLVYGGCSSIYCIHKCCRYVKRRKLEKEIHTRERLTSDTESCTGIEDTEVKRDHVTEPTSSGFIDNSKKTNEKELSPPPAYEQSVLREEDLPLEDFDDTNDIHPNQTATGRRTGNSRQQETSFTAAQKHIKDSDRSKLLEDPDRSKLSEERRDMDRVNNNDRSSSKTSRSVSRPRPSPSPHLSPPPAYEKRTSPDGKSSKGKEQFELTSRDIEDILNYYSDKKHMPDVIPEDTENVVPLRKKVRKWKQRVFNG